jgi:hypothetical protein
LGVFVEGLIVVGGPIGVLVAGGGVAVEGVLVTGGACATVTTAGALCPLPLLSAA